MSISQLVTDLGAHVCRECGQLHELVPSCVTCDQSLELRRYWYELGHDQGTRDAGVAFARERDQYVQKIATLSGLLGKETAKAAVGPSFAELEKRRYGGEYLGR
jgi:hypothetical protein